MPDKPILLLDVDGVLNVPGPKAGREVRLEWSPGEFISFFPVKNTRELLGLTWNRFEVYWLTCWREMANAIARWADLEERPVIDGPMFGDGDWKAKAASQVLASWKGRVAWLEDGISEEARTLVAARGWTYFHTDSFVGVTDEHLKNLRAFADTATMPAHLSSKR
jgi:hypothetical protein